MQCIGRGGLCASLISHISTVSYHMWGLWQPTRHGESSVGDVDDVGARLHGDVGHVMSSLGGADVEWHVILWWWPGDLQAQLSLASILAYNYHQTRRGSRSDRPTALTRPHAQHRSCESIVRITKSQLLSNVSNTRLVSFHLIWTELNSSDCIGLLSLSVSFYVCFFLSHSVLCVFGCLSVSGCLCSVFMGF